jgi:hypothetical protein
MKRDEIIKELMYCSCIDEPKFGEVRSQAIAILKRIDEVEIEKIIEPILDRWFSDGQHYEAEELAKTIVKFILDGKGE